MATVTFRFSNGKTISAEAFGGEHLLDLAQRVGVAIDAPCSGNGTCGKCRVRLVSGELDSAPTRHISAEDYAQGWRLACGSTPIGDVVVEVPDTASAFRTGIRTADLNDPTVRTAFDGVQAALEKAGLAGNPHIVAADLTMDEPTLSDTLPDNERVEQAAEEALGLEKIDISLYAIRKMAQVLRDNGFHVKAVAEMHEDGAEILDLLSPDDPMPVCGLAIDIGTTTVTGVLTDLTNGALLARASAGNGQIRFGADVINRIIESTRPGGSERLRKAITTETLVPLIRTLCAQAGVSLDRIYRVTVAGNTTMSHLLLGLYSDPVRMEPYIPSFFRIGRVRAADVIPGLNPSAGLQLAPNVGSYVGGDITAGVLATGLWNEEEMTLFLDLGTNGELVLGNSEFMFCCACSAGPAFEGGDISCGMRATDGAIQALSIDKETMDPTMNIIGKPGEKPIGLCGSGLLDTVAELFLRGICDARGKFVREGKRVAHDVHGMGRYIIAFPEESGNGREISITEVDLDNFIRAKGAIFSAITLLLRQISLTPDDISSIRIAGGIGGGINFEHAVKIGLLPDVDRSRFEYLGNTSLAGAYAMLRSRSAEDKVRELGANMTYVELSNEPGYMDEFVSACFLPHTDRRLFPSVEV